jgi:hypothetical protein
VNDADQGIAYISMPSQQNRQEIRAVFGALALSIARQMGLPQPNIVRPAIAPKKQGAAT